MTKVSDTILKKIEQGKIEPMPVWTYTVKNILFWSLWALAVLIGSIAVSAMLFVVTHAPWALREVTYETTAGFVLDLLPYFWVIALGLMIALGFYNLRHTKSGYKYSLAIVILLNILISIILGAVLFIVGMGEIAENATGKLPLRESIFEMQANRWSNPMNGLLAGEIVDILSADDGEVILTLTAFDDQDWKINISDLSDEEIQEAKIGNTIAVIGLSEQSIDGQLSMYACAFLEWGECCDEPLVSVREIFEDDERTTNCRGVRPFEALRRLSH
ncbi:hypothetical protein CO057_01450 [Candidatus Uhrbacteria bacterium CG_4_9_14_0_2_um_filter_41_50]|uniref:Uncharacterized protein n=1 Tax=Candidatus Uhrbacteria bacterium CG_4_9_14_0_2_um_filter_41_50 TaxID=1975031 RepID=A0A2M8EPN7_9BACT|nr:MAG: hypothetical protein CO057_01450 [Candidatus Uhrbacteria bacterium CG_4_9_14_0_2_um_filter_41_50]PJE75452.1 MAG: hypothetical protein COV03_00100 [Candidatus Uhrbacteria bacterium CG10_big_fil_rev_8_21_14_0_10_41_26]